MEWNLVRSVVEDILRNSGEYDGNKRFLTAYQIAVLVDEVDATLKDPLPLGGKGIGSRVSFAQQIARLLSDDVKNKKTIDNLEMQFLSLKGLDSFTFDVDKESSGSGISMFRIA